MKSALRSLLAVFAGYAGAALAMHLPGPTPIEMFQRPFWKSAPLVRTNSHAAQYAGRTTLNSGSATVVVSTRAINSDSIISHSMLGNANVASGTAIRPTEVKTISSGGYFTFGTQDGVGIARDTVIMWEIRRST